MTDKKFSNEEINRTISQGSASDRQEAIDFLDMQEEADEGMNQAVVSLEMQRTNTFFCPYCL